jgi:hypothetical protein
MQPEPARRLWPGPWSRVGALLLGGCLVYLVLAAAGLLLTRRFADGFLIQRDRAVSQWFLEHRTPTLDRWTHPGSTMSDTTTAIVATAVVVVALRLRLHRRRESTAPHPRRASRPGIPERPWPCTSGSPWC